MLRYFQHALPTAAKPEKWMESRETQVRSFFERYMKTNRNKAKQSSAYISAADEHFD
jgi:hypothetical protein